MTRELNTQIQLVRYLIHNQRLLGHRNATYSVQYARITRDELRSVLNRRGE